MSNQSPTQPSELAMELVKIADDWQCLSDPLETARLFDAKLAEFENKHWKSAETKPDNDRNVWAIVDAMPDPPVIEAYFSCEISEWCDPETGRFGLPVIKWREMVFPEPPLAASDEGGR